MLRSIAIAVMFALSLSAPASAALPLTVRVMPEHPAVPNQAGIGLDGSVGHPGGDCDDTNAAIHPGQADVIGNGIDDNCNGIADEDADGNPSTDTNDADGDGVTLESGDCNDHNASIRPGTVEIVGDLVDNNCNGLADEDADGHPSNDTVDHDGDGIPMAPDRIFLDGFEG